MDLNLSTDYQPASETGQQRISRGTQGEETGISSSTQMNRSESLLLDRNEPWREQHQAAAANSPYYSASPPPSIAWQGSWNGPTPLVIFNRLMDRRAAGLTNWSGDHQTIVAFAQEMRVLHDYINILEQRIGFAYDSILRIWNLFFIGTTCPQPQPNFR